MDQIFVRTLEQRPVLWGVAFLVLVVLILRRVRNTKAPLDIYTLPEHAAKDLRKAVVDQSRKYPDRIWQFAGQGDVPGTVILPRKYAIEIGRSPEHQLSFNEEVYRKFVGKYTRLAERVPLHNVTHVVRAQIARHPSIVIEMILDEVEVALQEHIGPCEDWTPIPLSETLKNITAQMSVRLFLGAPQCRNKEVVDLFVNHVTLMRDAAVALLEYPEWMRPIVAPFSKQLRRVHAARARLQTLIAPSLEKRRRQLEGKAADELPSDFLSWTIKENGDQALDPETQIEYQLAIGFAAIGTTTGFFINAFLDLCAHPSFIPILREEWTSMLDSSAGSITKQSLMTLHKTDSFLRESQRLNPVDLINMFRCVMSDTTLSDGTVLPKDTSLAIPIYAINRDPNVWGPDADEFDGERFEKLRRNDESGKASRMKWAMTSSDPAENVNFGYGKHACPGRFLAASEAKILLGRILGEYDIKFDDGIDVRPEPIATGSTLVPNLSTKVLFRKRKTGGK